MIEKLMHRYALSRRGAKDLIKGVVACTLQDISFMFPATLLYLFVKDLLANNLKGKTLFYVIGAVVCLIVVFTITLWQYNSTFLATYVETGTRRITLAEKLRKIPLSFFSKKDLADLTSTIMADCTYLETAFSHFIPPFAGSMISTVIIAISLLFFDVKMAIASLWVLPVAIIIVVSTAKVQQKLTQKSMDAKMDAANGIQECIDTIADLKSNNAEKRYLVSLDDKIDNVEKRVLKTNLVQPFLFPAHKWYSSWALRQRRLQARHFLLKVRLMCLHSLYFYFWFHDFTTRCKPLSKTLPQ